jgi:AcrR family transcriptional regulator
MTAPTRAHRLPPDDRRAAVLDAAREVFTRLGYSTANVADICAAAGIARGTFYLYFDSKTDILVAILRAVEDRVRAVLATRVPLEKAVTYLEKTDGAAALRFCEGRLADVLGAIVTDEKSLRVVMREARAAGGAIAETIERIDDMLLEALERDLRLAQQAPATSSAAWRRSSSWRWPRTKPSTCRSSSASA